MVHKRRKFDYMKFKGIILYSQPDKPFTKKAIKSWEKHYGVKLIQMYDPKLRLYSLIKKGR